MVNILLVCSAGMSTSLLVTKMQQAATERGIEAKIWAVADGKANDNIPEADVVLLGPQVRFLLDSMKQRAAGKPVGAIDMRAYGAMDGAAALDMALELIGA